MFVLRLPTLVPGKDLYLVELFDHLLILSSFVLVIKFAYANLQLAYVRKCTAYKS